MKAKREVEKVIDIGAPVDAVWDALTTVEGLTSFYGDRAAVTPGEGGTWQIGWGEEMLPVADITTWEPNRRLRLDYPDMAMAEEWEITAVDGGSTRVRLVYAGFGDEVDWDEWFDQFEAVSGVLFDLLSHWLENHRGDKVICLELRAVLGGDPNARASWDRMFGADGLAVIPAVGDLAVGDPAKLRLGDDTFVASLRTLADMNEAIFSLDGPGDPRLVTFARPGYVGMTMWGYGLTPADSDLYKERLDRAKARLERNPS